MGTWKLVTMVFTVVLAMAGSTQAQRMPRPTRYGAPNYRGTLQPMLRPSSNTRGSSYNANSNRYPYVIARPEDRQWIRETPIELRPNRPMHFWGNSRRRTLR